LPFATILHDAQKLDSVYKFDIMQRLKTVSVFWFLLQVFHGNWCSTTHKI